MKIDQINILLGDESSITQANAKIHIKADTKEASCAEQIKIDFEHTYSLELKEDKSGKTVLILTAGGIHRALDLSALQHLVSMTY
ncbi:MAG: hypothetical protein LBK98_06250 [Peptococcaceae bacterium]|jgi:hypothetical protein|nr:hypothetical protein [Peptococcaceae bacterium]